MGGVTVLFSSAKRATKRFHCNDALRDSSEADSFFATKCRIPRNLRTEVFLDDKANKLNSCVETSSWFRTGYDERAIGETGRACGEDRCQRSAQLGQS